MPRIWNSRYGVGYRWRRWTGNCAPPRVERRLKFWACRLGKEKSKTPLLAKNARNGPQIWASPPPHWVTLTVTVFELMILVPLVYCATIVVWPVAAKDVTHMGFTPF